MEQVNLKDYLKNKHLTVGKEIKTTQWQQLALKMWVDLKIKGKPNKRWFHFFKQANSKNKLGLVRATYTCMADISVTNPEYYFYKVYFNKLHGVTFDTK